MFLGFECNIHLNFVPKRPSLLSDCEKMEKNRYIRQPYFLCCYIPQWSTDLQCTLWKKFNMFLPRPPPSTLHLNMLASGLRQRSSGKTFHFVVTSLRTQVCSHGTTFLFVGGSRGGRVGGWGGGRERWGCRSWWEGESSVAELGSELSA